MRNRITRQTERMRIVLSQVIGHTGNPRVYFGTPQFLGTDHFSGRRFDQRWTGEKNRALPLDDNTLIRHRWHVGAACGTGSHHHRNLRNTLGRHIRLIIKNAPKMISVGKYLVLARQVRAARIDQVNAGQVIFLCNGLCSQMFLDRDRVVGTPLDRRIVGNNHAFNPIHTADSSNQSSGDNIIVTVHAEAGELPDFKEW